MVCLGNICRSSLAHGIMQSKLPEEKFYVDSAGTSRYHIGEKPDYRSIEISKSKGIDISNQRAREFIEADFTHLTLFMQWINLTTKILSLYLKMIKISRR